MSSVCADLHMYVLYNASRVPWTMKLSSRVILFQVTYIVPAGGAV